MNALPASWVEIAADADRTVELALKLSLLLAVAWLLHAALARANPRWRVLLWRGGAVLTMLVLPLTLAGPAIPLAVLPASANGTSIAAETSSLPMTPSPAAIEGNVLGLEREPEFAANASAMIRRPNEAEFGALAVQTPVDVAASASDTKIVERPWTLANYWWAAWGVGVLIGAILELVAVVRLGRLRRRAVPAETAHVEQAARIAAKLHWRRPFDVLVTSELATPCVIGAWRPAILLPGGQGQLSHGDELAAVFAHELQHLKNADLAWNALLRVGSRLMWFHPLAWRVRATHAAACDAVCDAAAADCLGDVAAYCRTLARLALRAAAPLPAAGLAMARASSTRRRIESLHRRVFSASLPRWGMLLAILGGLTGAVLLGTTSLTRAASGEDPLPKIDIPPPRPAFPPAGSLPAKTIVGTVTDAAGKPVADAHVWLPVRYVSPFKFLTATARCDDRGRFRLAVPEAWLPTEINKRNPIVWAYAPGHAIGSVNASAQLFGDKPDEPCRIELPPASGISFVVACADGSPAAAAKIAPVHFKSGYYVPRELAERITATTDAEGRGRMPALTREGISDVVVEFSGCGKQIFQAAMGSTDPAERKLKLRTAGRIEGRIVADQLELARGMVVSVESYGLTDVDGGTAMVRVDEQGRFVIPEIAHGRLLVEIVCDKRLPVQPRLPKQIDLLDGETLQLDIPLEMCVRVRGVVLAKDTGRPVAGATVFVGYGEFRQNDQAVTDDKGAYSAYALAGEAYAQTLYLPGDYVQVGDPWDERIVIPQDAKDFEMPAIEVTPTVKVAGTLLGRDGKPLPKVRMYVVVGNRRYGQGESNDKGEFSLSGVPAGIEVEKYEVWPGDLPLKAVATSTDPLVLRVQP